MQTNKCGNTKIRDREIVNRKVYEAAILNYFNIPHLTT